MDVVTHYQQAQTGLTLPLAEVQSASLRALAFPGSRDEAWRFTSVRKLTATPHRPMLGGVDLSASVLPLESSLDHPAAKVGSVAKSEDFGALNLGLFREGALVFVPADDADDDASITCTGGDGLTTPRVWIQADEGGEATVLLRHELGTGMHVPVTEVVAGPGSRIRLTQVIEGEAGTCVAQIACRLGAGATVEVRSIVAGGAIVRVELTSAGGEGSTIDTAGLVLARGKAHVDHHLEIEHDAADITSKQVFRNILDDKARAIFTGQVTVHKEVTGTDASQSANTLLLAQGASAVARPWLQIDNDDVVASHGATVGRLDDEALFYLQARGLDAIAARRLLTQAFAGEVVQLVPENARDAVATTVSGWLG